MEEQPSGNGRTPDSAVPRRRSPGRGDLPDRVYVPALFCVAALALLAVDDAGRSGARPEPQETCAVQEDGWPFAVGERMSYAAQLKGISVGEAHFTVRGRDSLHGRRPYVLRLEMKGSVPFFTLRDVQTSWLVTDPMQSLRFVQDLREGGHRVHRTYDIAPDASSYRVLARDPEADTVVRDTTISGDIPPNPLDEVAFFYYARRLPLKDGASCEVTRYFKPKDNPVRMRVAGVSTIRVPAGSFRVFELDPHLPGAGMFAPDHDPRVYVADRPDRRIVRITTETRFGTLSLHLKRYRERRPRR